MKNYRKKNSSFFKPNARSIFRFRTEPPDETDQGDGTEENDGKGGKPAGGGAGGKLDYEKLFKDKEAAYSKLETDSNASYTSLQKTLQKKEDALKVAQEALTQLQGDLTTTRTNFTDLETKSKTFEESSLKTSTEVKQLREEVARAKLIINEFPHLAAWESQGLIPVSPDALNEDGTVDSEKIRKLFTTYSNQLGALTDNAKKEFGKGGSKDPAKKEKVGKPSDGFLAAANKAAVTGDNAAYNENYEKYLTAMEQEKQTT